MRAAAENLASPATYRAQLLNLAGAITLGCLLLATAAGLASWRTIGGLPRVVPFGGALAAAAASAVALAAATRLQARWRRPLAGGLLLIHLASLTAVCSLVGGLREPFWVLFVPMVLVVGAASGTASALACGSLAAAGVYLSVVLSHSLPGSSGTLLVVLPLFPVAGWVASAQAAGTRAQATAAAAHRRAIEADVAALVEATRRLGTGDLRVIPAARVEGAPQTGRLAVSFADTAVALRRCVRGLAGVSAALDERAAAIAHTATEQASAGAQQESALRASTETMAELAGAAAAIAATAAAVTDCAGRTMGQVSEGEAAVAAATQAMGEIAARVRDITDRAGSLQRHGERISVILRAIDTLAVQTDRLALGAAIEAARVSDEALGFRVVADEIRRLAERSRLAAAEARSVLDGVNGQLCGTIAEGRAGTEALAVGTARVAGVVTALRLVATEAAGTAAAAAEIAQATAEQRLAAAEVASAMGELAARSVLFGAGSRRYVEAATLLRGLSGHVAGQLARFRLA